MPATAFKRNTIVALNRTRVKNGKVTDESLI